MINIFKSDKDGLWAHNGNKYTVKSIHKNKRHDYLKNGWFLRLDDALGAEVEKTEEVVETVKVEVTNANNKGRAGRASSARDNED
jgi:hypothetical protein